MLSPTLGAKLLFFINNNSNNNNNGYPYMTLFMYGSSPPMLKASRGFSLKTFSVDSLANDFIVHISLGLGKLIFNLK